MTMTWLKMRIAMSMMRTGLQLATAITNHDNQDDHDDGYDDDHDDDHNEHEYE